MSTPTQPRTAPGWARALIIAVGAVLAAVMILLGLWQMQVFRSQGERSAEHRTQEPAVALLERIPRDGPVGDVYGRTVTATGTYVPSQRVDVVDRKGVRRTLAALQVADGRVVPVVLGLDGTNAKVPAGQVEEQGVFLPAEPGAEHQPPAGTLGSVRLQELAQRWSQPLAPGFVTLDESHARAYGLSPATIELPEGDGAVRNAGYALQWWVFAAFALGGSILIARSMRPPVDDAPVQSSHDPDDEPAAEPGDR